MDRKNVSLGASFVGAGIRGVSYIGALQALKEEGISFSKVIGNSSGAYIAAMYANGMSTEKMVEGMTGLNWLTLLRLKKLKKRIEKYLGHVRIEDLKIPTFIQVTNMDTLTCEIITKGKVSDWLVASGNLNMYNPTRVGEFRYIDGGYSSGMGVKHLRDQGVDAVIAFDPGTATHDNSLRQNPIYPLLKLSTISLGKIFELDRRLYPPDLFISNLAHGYRAYDFKKIEELYQKGYDTMKERMGEILEFIDNLSKSKERAVPTS